MFRWINAHCLGTLLLGCWLSVSYAEVPFDGFIPFVGMGLTDEFEDSTAPNASPTFFIAQPSNSPGGMALGQGSDVYYDLALFDTGAATHILTNDAHVGFDIDGNGFDGTNIQIVGGATGQVVTEINDPLGVYISGLADRVSAGAELTLDPNDMRGQTSFATLSAPALGWTLPNIIGLPMAAQHQIYIRNDMPQIFEHQGRTVRTPHLEMRDLGAGNEGIVRRLPIKLRPAAAFVQGPLYIQNFDLTTFNLHENPLSPSVIESGGLYVDVDMGRGDNSIDDKEFLFDTGASLTVVSEQTAVRLGFDPILDTPDFVLQVQGSGGVQDGIPGFYADELSFDTVGGSFSVTNVPVAVLDLTNPSDPGNVLDGIIGMNLFVGRNLIIDANPSIGQGGNGPSLYIGDSVMQSRAWGTADISGDWLTAGNWKDASGMPSTDSPSTLWDATIANVRGSNQEAVLSSDSTVFRAKVAGSPGAQMTLRVTASGQLTTFADIDIREGGRVHLDGGRLDSQFIISRGTLSGDGNIFVGNATLSGAVRNQSGVVAPGDVDGDTTGRITIDGDFVNESEATLSIDLGGLVAGVSHDALTIEQSAFIGGTLEANLVDSFAPQVGDSFVFLTAVDGVSGEFTNWALPSGFQWDVVYTPTTVRLELTGLGLTGDLNGNGSLDCADIDALTAAVAAGSTSQTYDFTRRRYCRC